MAPLELVTPEKAEPPFPGLCSRHIELFYLFKIDSFSSPRTSVIICIIEKIRYKRMNKLDKIHPSFNVVT